MGPLRPESVAAVQAFMRCGDLAAGFTRLVCTGCGHQHLLAFTCKARHLCPACHQRRTLQSARWIARHVCLPVPHRQFVFTIPKLLRPIFRKRRHLLTHPFHTATTCLRDAFRTVLNLPDGRLAAAAAVHTFGDNLVFHPHLHVLAAHGLFDDEGRFHCLPDHGLTQLTELFIQSPGTPTAKTVIYPSRRSFHTKANFQVFAATDFLAYGLHSGTAPAVGGNFGGCAFC